MQSDRGCIQHSWRLDTGAAQAVPQRPDNQWAGGRAYRRAFPVHLSNTNSHAEGTEEDCASQRVHKLASDSSAAFLGQNLATGIGKQGLFGKECYGSCRTVPWQMFRSLYLANVNESLRKPPAGQSIMLVFKRPALQRSITNPDELIIAAAEQHGVPVRVVRPETDEIRTGSEEQIKV